MRTADHIYQNGPGVDELDLTNEETLLQPLSALEPLTISAKREETRQWLAIGLMLVLALTILGLLIIAWTRPETDLSSVVAQFLTPIVGLVGAATGFYYGGSRRSE
jgi:hypothetical protein